MQSVWGTTAKRGETGVRRPCTEDSLLPSVPYSSGVSTRTVSAAEDLLGSDLWNILERPWISASTHCGEWQLVAPLKLLQSPRDYRTIAASSPLDEFATLRFLTTLLYWGADGCGGVAQVRAQLLAGHVPPDLYSAIEAARPCFNLFDPVRPFLQDASLTDKPNKPVGSLYAEVATGTNIAHFDHSRDGSSPLCLCCVVRGLLRLVPWTQSGGAGLAPSIHGAPPIAILPMGQSIALTLAACLVDRDIKLGAPTWTGTFRPDDLGGHIPLLEGLTWNPRRVRIPKPNQQARCRLCGTFGPAIAQIVFQKNGAVLKPKGGGKDLRSIAWHDPAFRYRKSEPIRSANEQAASLSQDVLKNFEDLVGSENSAQAASAMSLIVPCTNPANNKTFDHRRVEIRAGFQRNCVAVEHSGATGLLLSEHLLNFELPRRSGATGRVRDVLERFVGTAIQVLRVSDWSALRRAIGKSMNQEPTAFAIFSAIYWRVRSGGRLVLPRESAWMLLKLLALAPSARRGTACNQRLSVLLDALPTRQAQRSRGDIEARCPYPVAPQRRLRLERALVAAIETNLAAGRDIAWIELGIFLIDSEP